MVYCSDMDIALSNLNVRDRLLETATKLFYERGYLSTGVNEIVKQAGIAKASFYHHFKTKEDLLVVVLERRHDQQMAEIRSASMRGQTPAEKIRNVFRWLGETSTSGATAQGCIYLNALSDFRGVGTRILQLVRWHKAAKRQFLLELVAAHFRNSDRTEQEVQAVADEVYLLSQAILAVSPVHSGSWAGETAWRMAASRLGLAASLPDE